MPACFLALAALPLLQESVPAELPGAVSEVLDGAVAERLARVSAEADAWDTEVLGERAAKRLKSVFAALESGAEPEGLDAFRISPLASVREEPAFADELFRVRRRPTDADADDASLEPVAETLREFLTAWGDDVGSKLKVIAVQASGDDASTDVLLTRWSPAEAPRRQTNSSWRCRWRSDPEGDALVLTGLEVLRHEEVTRLTEEPLFLDRTGDLFRDAPSFERQLLPSLPHWRGRLDASLGVSLLGHQGLAVGDADGDGLEDLYLCQPGGLPNRLYRARPDGRVEDVSSAAGVDFLDSSRSALWLDLDDDGDSDLVVALFGSLLFLENDGKAHFELRTEAASPTVTSIAAADTDLDGDLDVYACGYIPPYDGDATPTPYHDANNGMRNALFENRGEWSFVDVTEEVGLDENNRRFSFSAVFEDVDNDGDPDLYVANDFGRNALYRNDGSGHFDDVAAEAGVEDISAGMGVSFADFDGDGWMDLYVSNMYSSAGRRITYQRRFESDLGQEALGQLRRHARGNTLFRNLGDGRFADVTEERQVEMGRWAWGSLFRDFNDDGAPDLIVPNGFVTGDADADDL